MTQVNRSRTFESSPDAMWARIGDFHGADTWHPAVASSDSRDDGNVRELTLGDGAKIVETITDDGPHSYSYRIDESPLPLRDFHATLAVGDAAGSGCEVTWDARFEPEGASEKEASELVGGMFDAGLDNL